MRVKEDHYYVLGDHRNASNDSRSWGWYLKVYLWQGRIPVLAS